MQRIRAILIDANTRTIENLLIEIEEGGNVSFEVRDMLLNFDSGFCNPIPSKPEVMAMFEEGPEPGEANMARIGDDCGFPGRTLLFGAKEDGSDFDVPLTIEEARELVSFYRGVSPEPRPYTARYRLPPLRSPQAIANGIGMLAFLVDPEVHEIRPVEVDPQEVYEAVERIYRDRFDADMIDLGNGAAIIYPLGPVDEGVEYDFFECFERRHIVGMCLLVGYENEKFCASSFRPSELEMRVHFYRGKFVEWYERGPLAGYERVVEVEGRRTRAGWTPGERYHLY